MPDGNRWSFKVVFDYGEHDKRPAPNFGYTGLAFRPDPFSIYKPRFEIRKYRLCRRALLFHHFEEIGSEPNLVRSFDIEYNLDDDKAISGLQISSLSCTGYRPDGNGDIYTKKIPPLTFTYTQATPDEEIQELDQKLDGFGNQPADLYGEGVNGLLHRLGNNFYCPASSFHLLASGI